LAATLRFRFGCLDVRVLGDAAIASGIVVTTDTTGSLLGHAVFTDVFVHRGGRSQAVTAQETPVLPMNSETLTSVHNCRERRGDVLLADRDEGERHSDFARGVGG
jgi:hypothetical protein